MSLKMKLGYAFQFGEGKVLTIIRGLPGSGKSTWAKSMASFSAGPVHIESDMWFSRFGDYRWSQEEVHRAHRWTLQTTQVMLQTRGLCVVTGCFVRYNDLFDYVDFAHQFKIDCNVITMENDFGSIHNVPDETMQRMRARFLPHETIMEKIKNDFPG